MISDGNFSPPTSQPPLGMSAQATPVVSSLLGGTGTGSGAEPRFLPNFPPLGPPRCLGAVSRTNTAVTTALGRQPLVSAAAGAAAGGNATRPPVSVAVSAASAPSVRAVPTPRLEAPAAPAPMASAAWRPTLPPSRECRYRPIRAGSGRCSQTSSPSAQTTRGMSGPRSFSATWGRHQLPCYKPMYFMWINFFSSPSGTRLPMRLPWTGFRGGSPGELLEAARSMAIPPWTFALMSGWTTSQ